MMNANSLTLLPEVMAQSDGAGPVIDVAPERGKLLIVTLSIDYAAEQGGLTISLWGSPNGRDWGSKPMLKLPEEYYDGVSPVVRS